MRVGHGMGPLFAQQHAYLAMGRGATLIVGLFFCPVLMMTLCEAHINTMRFVEQMSLGWEVL